MKHLKLWHLVSTIDYCSSTRFTDKSILDSSQKFGSRAQGNKRLGTRLCSWDITQDDNKHVQVEIELVSTQIIVKRTVAHSMNQAHHLRHTTHTV